MASYVYTKNDRKVVNCNDDPIFFHNYENGNSLDLTNNGYDGTPVGVDFGKDGAYFNESYITLGDIPSLEGEEKSFSFRCKANSNSSTIISNEGGSVVAGIQIEVGGTSYINVDGNYLGISVPRYDIETTYDITYSSPKNELKLYVNGEFYSNFNTSGSYSNLKSSFMIGKRRSFNGDYFNGSIKFIKGYNYQRTPEQIKADYNKNVKLVKQPLVNINADEKVYGAGEFVDNEIKVETGSVKVVEDVSGDIPIGTKSIEQVTAGITSIPSKQAYGTWKFDVYKGIDANTTIIYLLGDISRTGYAILLTTGEHISFRRVVSGSSDATLFQTVTSYIKINNWYNFRITRTTDGEFTVYIKSPTDTNFIDWTLVDTTGGTGTNPVTDNTYTTSNFMVIDNGVGDRVSAIKIFSGVKK